ncbi:MAG: DUF192 domain-containing protein [Actinobacteria bacterium]|nr:DUF192 domain-containing protein [Actinomycetota bacterium]
MRRTLAALLLVPFLGVACASSDDAAETATLEIRTSDGVRSFEVEVADTPSERRVGLMHREQLAPVDGMAFLWGEPIEGTFWMKDTLIPLSVAFWDEDGRIVAILDMEPCVADPCPSYGPGEPFLGAVELGQGVFGQAGVEVGDRVELHEPNV